MNRIPLIYSNRKQVEYQTSATEAVSLYATVTGSDYQWVFTPVDQVNIVSGDITSRNITINSTLSAESFGATWVSKDQPTISASDFCEIQIRTPEILTSEQNPQTLYENLSFPYTLSELYIGINENAVEETFNVYMTRLYENFNYIVNKIQYVDMAPTFLTFRYGDTVNPVTSYQGLQWQQFSSEYNAPTANPYFWSYTEPCSTQGVSVNTSFTLFVSSNQIHMLSNDSNAPIVDVREYPLYTSDPFVNIKSAILEQDGTVWVMEESGRITRMIYDGTWNFSSIWIDKVKNPVQMIVDSNNIYIISEQSNTTDHEIRIFDKNMVFVQSIYNSNNKIIAGICTSRDYLIALNNSEGISVLYHHPKIDLQDTTLVTDTVVSLTYKYFPEQDPKYQDDTLKLIQSCADDYFIYAATTNLIYKLTQNGSLVGFAGGEIIQTSYDITAQTTPITDYTITGIANDTYHNLFISTNYDILRFLDISKFNTVQSAPNVVSLIDSLWSLDDLKVNKNENCSYWVYNRIFNRLYDNILLVRSIIGGSLVEESGTITISPMKFGKFPQLPYKKEEIFVGINELHCEGALNRNIKKLYECIDVLVSAMNNGKQYRIGDQLGGSGETPIYWNGVFIFDGSLTFSGIFAK